METQTFLFFGISGAGKGTQAKLLETYLKDHDQENETIHLSTGELLRTFMETGSYTANKVRAILDKGGLLDEFLPIWIWTGFLNERIKTNTEHLLLDGIARQANEAPILDGALSFYGRTVRNVIVVNISRELAHKRLKERNRFDDTDEEIRKRFEWFDTNVEPSISYFRSNERYNVYDIDGEKSVEEVFKEILEKTGL